MRNDRGALLFRVTTYRFWQPWQPTKIASLVMLALIVPLFVSDYSRRGHLDRSLASLAALFLFLLLSPVNVKFYEKGIHFPAGFIAWSDIVGYRWDGDMLIIAERSGLLYGGPTLLGGTVRVPRSQRAQVENLLAQARSMNRPAPMMLPPAQAQKTTFSDD
jgi:hypothetical protein